MKNHHPCTFLCGKEVLNSHFSLWISLSTGCGLLRSLDRGMPGFVDEEDIWGRRRPPVGREVAFPFASARADDGDRIGFGVVRSRVRRLRPADGGRKCRPSPGPSSHGRRASSVSASNWYRWCASSLEARAGSTEQEVRLLPEAYLHDSHVMGSRFVQEVTRL